MPQETPIANPPLAPKEKEALGKLTQEDKAAVDEEILSCLLPHWQKVANVVIMAEEKLRGRYPQLTYIFYAERIRLLAKERRLESQGDLRYMRFNEVRLFDEG